MEEGGGFRVDTGRSWERGEDYEASPCLNSRNFLFGKAFLSIVLHIDRTKEDDYILQSGLRGGENENIKTSLGPSKKGVR